MVEIEAKVKIKRVDEWATNWDNEQDKRNELEQLKYDMKMAIFELRASYLIKQYKNIL